MERLTLMDNEDCYNQLRMGKDAFARLVNILWLFTLDEDMGTIMLNLLVDLDLALALRIVASPTVVPKYDIVAVLLSNLKWPKFMFLTVTRAFAWGKF